MTDYDLESKILIEALRDAKGLQDTPMPQMTTQRFGDINHVMAPGALATIAPAINQAMGRFQRDAYQQKARDLSAQQQGEYEGMLRELTTPGTKRVLKQALRQGEGPLMEPNFDQVEETAPLSPLEESQRRLNVYGKMSRLPMAAQMAQAGIKSEVDFPERQALLEQQQLQQKELAQQRLDMQRSQNEMANLFKMGMLGQGQDRIDIAREAQTERTRQAQEKIDAKRTAEAEKADGANALANQQIANIDQMIGRRDDAGNLLPDSAPHGGFGQYVGFGVPGLRFIEGSDTAGYEALHKQVTSQARLEGVQSMKGTGAVSNAEGEAAAKAITGMSKSQNEKEYVKSALDYRKIMQLAVDRRQRGVSITPDGKREYATGSEAAPAQPGAGVAQGAKVVSEVQLKNGKTGVLWSDGSRTIK